MLYFMLIVGGEFRKIVQNNVALDSFWVFLAYIYARIVNAV